MSMSDQGHLALAIAKVLREHTNATTAINTGKELAAAVALFVDSRLGAASTPATEPSNTLRELAEQALALRTAALYYWLHSPSETGAAELRQAADAIAPMLAELGMLEPEPADVPAVALANNVALNNWVTEQTLAQYLWAAPDNLKGAIEDFVTLADKVSTYGIELAVATRTSSTDPAWLEKAPLFERLNAFICAYQYFPHQPSAAQANTDPEQQLAPRHSHICPQCDGTGRRYTTEATA